MSGDYIPPKDADAFTYMTTLASVLAADPASYGLTPAEVSSLTNKTNEFGQSLQTVDALKAATSAEVAHKNELRGALEDLARPIVAKIQSNLAVSDQLKTEAGLPVHDNKPSVTAPAVPTNLVVELRGNGVIHLNWNRNGNLPHTAFVIEARVGEATSFSQVDVVTATRYDHVNQPAGVPVVYRVRARRTGATSEPSNEAGAYL